MDKNYDDMIGLPRPASGKHPPMSMLNRAAQFSPFAALTGYGAAIRETGRLTDRKIELDDYEKEEINGKIQFIAEHLDEECEVGITYFRPDGRKAGGAYADIAGVVKMVDEVERMIVMQDGRKIPVDDVLAIETEWNGEGDK